MKFQLLILSSNFYKRYSHEAFLREFSIMVAPRYLWGWEPFWKPRILVILLCMFKGELKNKIRYFLSFIIAPYAIIKVSILVLIAWDSLLEGAPMSNVSSINCGWDRGPTFWFSLIRFHKPLIQAWLKTYGKSLYYKDE